MEVGSPSARPDASDPADADGEPIPISAIQHAVYCMRQAALIHLERLWSENALTAQGRVVHEASDLATTRHVRGTRRVSALQLGSSRLWLAGVADLVEFRPAPDGRETPFPIEIKRGRPKLHRADEAQLCAQALCLEEMTGREVPEGALFYAETRRRTPVAFDPELRRLTEEAAHRLREVFASRRTPPATYKATLCRACSLLELCRPRLSGRSALAWRTEALNALLLGEGTVSKAPESEL